MPRRVRRAGYDGPFESNRRPGDRHPRAPVRDEPVKDRLVRDLVDRLAAGADEIGVELGVGGEGQEERQDRPGTPTGIGPPPRVRLVVTTY